MKFKKPCTLGQIHLMIEDYGIVFIDWFKRTKVTRCGTNLLDEHEHEPFPFVYPEIKIIFSLEHILTTGLLPPFSNIKQYSRRFIRHVNTYLKENSCGRTFQKFKRLCTLLEVAALSNTGIINYTNVANDAQIPLQIMPSV